MTPSHFSSRQLNDFKNVIKAFHVVFPFTRGIVTDITPNTLQLCEI